MLFSTSGRAPTLRRSRRGPGSWFSSSPSNDADAAMRDAGNALRHAGEDIADAARLISVDATRQIRANAAAAADEAAHQIRANAAAARDEAARQVGANAAAVRDEAKRQIRRNAATLRDSASSIPDDLLPAGMDAIRKSVDKVVPRRKKRSRGPLFSILTILAVTGLALFGAQMLMTRWSTSTSRRRERRRSEATSATTGTTGVADTLGMPGTMRPAPVPPPDAESELATFDRDAGIRAATEGMASTDNRPVSGSATPAIEAADGT